MLSEYFSTGSFGQYSDQESEAVAVARQSGASVLPLFKAVTIATAIKGTLSLHEPLTTYSLHDDFAKTDGAIAAAGGRLRLHSHSDPPHTPLHQLLAWPSWPLSSMTTSGPSQPSRHLPTTHATKHYSRRCVNTYTMYVPHITLCLMRIHCIPSLPHAPPSARA